MQVCTGAYKCINVRKICSYMRKMPEDLKRTKIPGERLGGSYEHGRFRTIPYETPTPPLRRSLILKDFPSYDAAAVRGFRRTADYADCTVRHLTVNPVPIRGGERNGRRRPCLDDSSHREQSTERNNGVKNKYVAEAKPEPPIKFSIKCLDAKMDEPATSAPYSGEFQAADLLPAMRR
jgi:hypothetical protein